LGCPFVIEDLFAVGLGFDIAGAYLLARGLLTSPAEIARRSVSITGFNSLLMASQARDRIDGAIGLAALLFGFALQALAYALTLGGLGGGRDGDARRGLVALALSGAAVALVLVAWKAVSERLLRRTLLSVARLNYETEPMEMSDKPYAGTLVYLAKELGHREQEGEDWVSFAKRAFDVDEVNLNMVSPREHRFRGDPADPESCGNP